MPPTTATPPVPPQSEEEEWAVEEDCSVPVEDFEEKIPDPAFKVGGAKWGRGAGGALGGDCGEVGAVRGIWGLEECRGWFGGGSVDDLGVLGGAQRTA